LSQVSNSSYALDISKSTKISNSLVTKILKSSKISVASVLVDTSHILDSSNLSKISDSIDSGNSNITKISQASDSLIVSESSEIFDSSET
jgi:hypothetical protein